MLLLVDIQKCIFVVLSSFIKNATYFSPNSCLTFFFRTVATLRNKKKLAAVARNTQEGNPTNGESRNTYVARIIEEYITQVSEEIEGRVTRNLSQEVNRTESSILSALSPNNTNVSFTHRYGHNREAFWKDSGSQTWKPRNQVGIVPRMILTLKWNTSSINSTPLLIQTQKRLLTMPS